MHGLVSLALLLIPMVNARPQGIGVVICDSTAVTQFSYKTDSSEDVTEQAGDKGWENYDAQTCTSYGERKLRPHYAIPVDSYLPRN